MYLSKSVALGNFIKKYRGKLSPEACGLPLKNRRRVSGLRREELADICGISTTWLCWIEQGRAKSISPVTLDSISRALRLSAEERVYVFMLSDLYDPYISAKSSVSSADGLSVTEYILYNLSQPCFITNKRMDVLGINECAEELFTSNSSDAQLQGDNLLEHVFSNPNLKNSIENWESFASKIVAKVRYNLVSLQNDEKFTDLINKLSHESGEFNACWDQHDVLRSSLGEIRFNQKGRAVRAYVHNSLFVDCNDDLSVNVLTACS